MINKIGSSTLNLTESYNKITNKRTKIFTMNQLNENIGPVPGTLVGINSRTRVLMICGLVSIFPS